MLVSLFHGVRIASLGKGGRRTDTSEVKLGILDNVPEKISKLLSLDDSRYNGYIKASVIFGE